jgi:predicted nucleic acid-binding protein
MTETIFVDTNVFFYAVDLANPRKQQGGQPAPYLLTEDLQSGQDFDSLLVVNPFTTDPESLF